MPPLPVPGRYDIADGDIYYNNSVRIEQLISSYILINNISAIKIYQCDLVRQCGSSEEPTLCYPIYIDYP